MAEFADNWQAGDTEELSEEPESTTTNSRRSFVWLQILAFLLGLGLLILVINRVGVQPLFDALLRIGFGFFVIVGLSGVRHVLRTISMRAAVPAEHRRFNFRQAFAARLGGAVVMLVRYPLPPQVNLVLLAIAAVAASGIIIAAVAMKRRVMLLTWIIDRLAQLRLSPRVILKRRHTIYRLESKVYDFYKHHPGAFFAMIACNLVAHAASVVEVYLALKML